MPPRRETVFKIVAAGGSALIGLLIVELGLRLVLGAPPVWKIPQERYDFDAVIQHRLKPGQTAWTHAEPVRTNSLGYRGPEWSATPAAGICRVLALGDSQTFGVGVAEEDTWPARLAATLSASDPDRDWEVLNAGVPGTNTWQHRVLMEELQASASPQLVVLGFFVNDVARPYVPDPAMGERERSAAKAGLVATLKRSAFLGAVRNVWSTLGQAIRPSRAFEADNHVVDGTPDPLIDAAWESVEASLTAMQEATRSDGAPFVVVAMPRRDQISGKNGGRAYNDRLAEIADRLGIPFADALDDLRDLHEREGGRNVNIAWDGHHTPEANQTIAEKVVPLILDQAAETCPSLRSER